MKNLKPCPYCNSQKLAIRPFTVNSMCYTGIIYIACGTRGPVLPKEDVAAAAWNSLSRKADNNSVTDKSPENIPEPEK